MAFSQRLEQQPRRDEEEKADNRRDATQSQSCWPGGPASAVGPASAELDRCAGSDINGPGAIITVSMLTGSTGGAGNTSAPLLNPPLAQTAS